MTSTRVEEVIWHDAECGDYGADLPLWRELAARADGPVLELGCGTGRVALDLARHGHDVSALDHDPALVGALEERAAAEGLELATRVADARSFQLDERFGLVLAPMQLVQLLDDRGRAAMLAATRNHLRHLGLAAFAITSAQEGWTLSAGSPPPLPDVRETDGWIYSSLPVGVESSGGSVVVRRLRQVVSPGGELSESEDEVRLAGVGPAVLEQEAGRVGLGALERREVAPTDAHIGSAVVVLEAG